MLRVRVSYPDLNYINIMTVTYWQALIYTLLIILGFMGGGILIGTLLSPIWVIPYFCILAGFGVWFYRYINK